MAIEVGASTRSAWHGVLERLPRPMRRALFVVAAAGASGLASLDAVLPALGLSLRDLEPAELRKLLIADDDGLRLRHPLLGPVLRAATPTATRMGVYGHWRPQRAPMSNRGSCLAATGPDDEAGDPAVRAQFVCSLTRSWQQSGLYST